MFGSLFDDVLALTKEWKPEQEYPNENKFRDDLMDFLRKKLNQAPMFGSAQRISVKKEDGRGLCDIAVDRRIGIELKKDLQKKTQVNRLVGQLMDYKKEYENIVVVLVGGTNEEALDTLMERIEDMGGGNVGFSQGPRMEVVIVKGTQSEASEERSPWGF